MVIVQILLMVNYSALLLQVVLAAALPSASKRMTTSQLLRISATSSRTMENPSRYISYSSQQPEKVVVSDKQLKLMSVLILIFNFG